MGFKVIRSPEATPRGFWDGESDMRLLTCLLWLTTGLLSACASWIWFSPEWFNEDRLGKEALANRASFELSCPAADLQFVGVGNDSNYRSVGVSGCGKKAVYVYTNSVWVLNSDEHPAAP